MPKTTRFKRSENTSDMTVKWTDKVEGSSLTVCFHDVATKLQARVSLYGLAKLCEDRSSSADPDDKFTVRREVMQLLHEGRWEKEAVRGAPVVSPEIEALSEITGESIPAIQKARKRYSDEQWLIILERSGAKERAEEIREDRKAESEGPDFSRFLEGEEEDEDEELARLMAEDES